MMIDDVCGPGPSDRIHAHKYNQLLVTMCSNLIVSRTYLFYPPDVAFSRSDDSWHRSSWIIWALWIWGHFCIVSVEGTWF